MILHSVSSIDHEHAGPSYSVSRLCEALMEAGFETGLAVLDWVPGTVSPPWVKRFPLGIGPKWYGRLFVVARYLVMLMKQACLEESRLITIAVWGYRYMPTWVSINQTITNE